MQSDKKKKKTSRFLSKFVLKATFFPYNFLTYLMLLTTGYKMKYLAIIPARGGSKGIRRKNLIALDSMPLIQYSISAAKASLNLSAFTVSTEDEEIFQYCQSQDLKKIHRRPAELATDTASTIDVIIDVLKDYENDRPENIVLLQPTSPLRTGQIIDEAINFFEDSGEESIVSVNEMQDHPFECIQTENENWNFLQKPNQSLSRRQDYSQGYYFINGSIYICKTETLLKTKRFVTEGKTKLFIMKKEFGIDIDEEFDLFRAEAALKYLRHKGRM